MYEVYYLSYFRNKFSNQIGGEIERRRQLEVTNLRSNLNDSLAEVRSRMSWGRRFRPNQIRGNQNEQLNLQLNPESSEVRQSDASANRNPFTRRITENINEQMRTLDITQRIQESINSILDSEDYNQLDLTSNVADFRSRTDDIDDRSFLRLMRLDRNAQLKYDEVIIDEWQPEIVLLEFDINIKLVFLSDLIKQYGPLGLIIVSRLRQMNVLDGSLSYQTETFPFIKNLTYYIYVEISKQLDSQILADGHLSAKSAFLYKLVIDVKAIDFIKQKPPKLKWFPYRYI
ncbi:UNKNOWN [Stylonychia lemnae]|uniref:Uncharacterized protein n=1 Tax=Stylonychia lemnae TaxID=5949 RepID=A0A078ATJ6_STYLE|nr:UNKNOWN [Stylonychia lemnae]|eukprot:CDW85755.1 UNKNOWN [Stylonychia lemnae]